jgi:hypothetical protein
MKAQRAVRCFCEHAIEEHGVAVHVELEARAKPLNDGHRAGMAVGPAGTACPSAVPAEHGPHEHPDDGPAERVVEGEAVAQPVRYSEDPLPDGHFLRNRRQSGKLVTEQATTRRTSGIGCSVNLHETPFEVPMLFRAAAARHHRRALPDAAEHQRDREPQQPRRPLRPQRSPLAQRPNAGPLDCRWPPGEHPQLPSAARSSGSRCPPPCPRSHGHGQQEGGGVEPSPRAATHRHSTASGTSPSQSPGLTAGSQSPRLSAAPDNGPAATVVSV